jgi:hypothetical protein
MRQGQAPVKTQPDSTAKPPNWSDINDSRDRVNDIISGIDSARANFKSTYTAFDDGRYIDTFYNGYQGISGTMRALRGLFYVAGDGLENLGYKHDAKLLKDVAGRINSARRYLDGVLTPISGLRDIADVFTDPSSTRRQKLSTIADYFGGVGQTTGLAIIKLDHRDGDTLLQQFGYAMFVLAETGYAAHQVIAGYSQAIDALGKRDLTTAGKAAINATVNLIEGPQIVANYIADVFNLLGMKMHADQMYALSARMLTAENAVKSVALVLNPILGR